jgi:hypothetical protein
MADTRREFVKKALYVPPAIITASVIPSLASAGSVKGEDTGGRVRNHDHFQQRRQNRRSRWRDFWRNYFG